MKLSVIDIKGKSQGELEIQFELIEDRKGEQAVHESVTAFRAAQRSGTACTKTAGEVAGTNKKPWKQKGTGRARAGSFQSPIWRGGGVVFGPKPRDYTKKVSKTSRKLAMRKAISSRVQAGDVQILSEFKTDSPKTRNLLALIEGLKLEGTTLFVIDAPDRNLLLASRNVPEIEVVTVDFLNPYQVLRYDKLVFTRGAFEQVEQRLTK